MNQLAAVEPPALLTMLLDENFGSSQGELLIGGLPVRQLAHAYGTPLYIYNADILRRRYRALSRALSGFAEVFYSIKANPNPALAAILVELGAGLEIASGAEFLLARKAGAAPERILFAGPGKGREELELAIAGGIGEIHLESFEEIEMVAELAEKLARSVEVSIRVNPSAAAQGGAMRMGGKPAAFGFDEESLDEVVSAIERHPRLHLIGLHLFAGTQILDAQVLLTQWRYGLDLAEKLANRLGRPLKSIDLGGGLGIPYHQGDATLDLSILAQGAKALAGHVARTPLLKDARILIEPGRYLVGPCGVYLMAVRSVKMSRGQRFIVTDGGMHHHLAASGNLGQVIKRDYPVLAATRMNEATRGATALVGPLCTPLDTLGRQTPIAEVTAGDLMVVLQSGAYGLSSSPVGFLSHPMPAEVLVDGGNHRVIRARGSFEQPFVQPG
jgi:diaminopimelate decarboxylase